MGQNRQLLEELEEGGLAPLDVVDDTDERLCAGGRLEQPANRERDLFGRVDAVAGVEQAPQRRDHLQVELELREPGLQLSHDLDNRQVGDPVAVRNAAAANHSRPVERRQELVGEPGLADARGAEDRDQLAAAVAPGALEAVEEPAELLPATDHRHVEMPAEAALRVHADEPPRRQRFALALHGQRLDGVCNHRGSHERERFRSEQDLVRPRGLLQASGDVDRIADGEPVFGSGDHLPRVHSDPERQPCPVLALELVVEVAGSLAQRGCGTHGAKGVVFVQHRHAEDGHDRVADELLDHAAVLLDRAPGRVVVPGQHPAEHLRIEPFTHRGRVGQVAEEDGDPPARLTIGRQERRAAGMAEPRVLRVPLAAGGTGRHVTSVAAFAGRR